MKTKLKNWNKEVFGNIFKEKKMLEQSMEEIQQHIINYGLTDQMKEDERSSIRNGKRKLNRRRNSANRSLESDGSGVVNITPDFSIAL